VWTALPEALGPADGSAAPQSIAGPQWVNGVLEIPKYFGAFLDAPLATYDPNHRHKWRSHELLHRYVGFFWSPDMTRFEAYLGARLAELLPVVHWYALDEIGRARCAAHRGKLLRREFCPECEACRRPYWELPAPGSDEVARWEAEASRHLREELEVIESEMHLGVPIASPRPGLDASSDARAYLDGHWERVTAWSFGSWIELFGEPSLDFEASVQDMRARVSTAARELLEDEIEVDLDVATALRERQRLRDLGYRVCCALEWHEEPGVWTALEALALAANSMASGSPIEGGNEFEADLLARLRASSRHFPPGLVDGLADAGLCFGGRPNGPTSLAQLTRGLESALPESSAAGLISADAVAAFAAGSAFDAPGGIAVRFVNFLGADCPTHLRLEAWLRAGPHRDRDGEDFGAVPDLLTSTRSLRLNQTLRRGRFGAAAIEGLLGWRPEGESAELAAIYLRGEPRVIELDAEISACLDGLNASDGAELLTNAALAGLVEAAFIWWLPPATGA
jgi:hypothetical protein